MPTEVKICGLSSPEAVDAAVEAGADLIGFVFFPKSPRNVSLEHAALLSARARGRAAVVALTVDPSDDLVAAIAETLRPDLLQLHGSETPERVTEIRSRGMPVMKVIGVADGEDLRAASRYSAVADRLMVDAKPPKDATRPGGNGIAFDWSLLDGFDPGLPWLLSGGLTPDNVAAALARTGAPGVDVSSGVEAAPGVKDPALIRSFIRAVRDSAAAPARMAG